MAGQRQAFCRPEKSRVIFVEGFDDLRIVKEICRSLQLENIQIVAYAELGTLGDYLDLFVRDEKFQIVERIGLTKDADSNFGAAQQSLASSWQRAEGVLNQFRLAVPPHFNFVVPDNQHAGRIEDICIASPAYPDILQCARDLLACATPYATYALDREKSLVAGYLAMMRTPGLNLGAGAERGCWNLNSQAFQPLRHFIRSVTA